MTLVTASGFYLTFLRDQTNGSIQGGPKSNPLPNNQKIVLKPVNEIRFIRQIKV